MPGYPCCCCSWDCDHCSACPAEEYQLVLSGLDDEANTCCGDYDGTYIADRTSVFADCGWTTDAIDNSGFTYPCNINDMILRLIFDEDKIQVIIRYRPDGSSWGNYALFEASRTSPYDCDLDGLVLNCTDYAWHNPGTSQHCDATNATITITAL